MQGRLPARAPHFGSWMPCSSFQRSFGQLLRSRSQRIMLRRGCQELVNPDHFIHFFLGLSRSMARSMPMAMAKEAIMRVSWCMSFSSNQTPQTRNCCREMPKAMRMKIRISMFLCIRIRVFTMLLYDSEEH